MTNQDFKRILLIQFRPIGDVLLTTPLIKILRKHYPKSHIAFMVEPVPGQILENNPDLDEILYYTHRKDDILKSYKFFRSVGKMGWDLTIDVYGTPGTAWATIFSGARTRVGYDVRVRRHAYTHKVNHLVADRYSALKKFVLLKAIGIEEETPELTYELTGQQREFGNSFFNEKNITGDNLTVCISPTSKRPVRMWILSEWAKLTDILHEKFAANVIVAWGPGEEQTIDELVSMTKTKPIVIPKTNLGEMSGIIRKCHVFISNNNGPMHIATALKVPTISIFGNTSPLTWGYPDPQRHRILIGDVPCIQCGTRSCWHMSCMYDVKAEHVVNEIGKFDGLRHFFKDKVA